MVYFIVFGDTTSSLVAALAHIDWKSTFYVDRWFYDVILGAVLLAICLKKELAELAWVGYVLFSCLAIFTFLCFYLLVIDPKFDPTYNPDDTNFLTFKWRWSTISSLSVTLLAYSYQ